MVCYNSGLYQAGRIQTAPYGNQGRQQRSTEKNSAVLLKAGLCGCWMAITKHVSEMYKSAKEQFKYMMDNKKSY